jgi:hypothetical protein
VAQENDAERAAWICAAFMVPVMERQRGRQTALTGMGITSSADAENNRRSLKQHHKRSGLSNW